MFSRIVVIAMMIFGLSAGLTGCGGGGGGGTGSATLQSIAVTPSNQSLGIGATQAYTATGTYSDATTQNISASVTWASSASSITSINVSGVASALIAGSTNISAAVSGVTGTTPLTVTAKTLKSIAVTPAFASITTVGTQQLTATGTYSDGTTAPITSSITWATTDATIATVSTAGLVTGVAPQNGLAITATSGGFSGMSRVSVTPSTNALVSLSVVPQPMVIGETFPFPTVNATFQLIGSTYPFVYWTSSDPTVASVDNTQGLITAIKAGTTTLTATSGSLSATYNLTVSPPPLISITVLPASPTIASGATVQMIATGVYTDTNLNKDITSSVTWSSSNPALVTVSAAGLARGVAAGSATISAASSGVTGNTVATVPAPTTPPTTPTTVTLLPIADNTIIFSSTNAAKETTAFPTGTLAVGCSWNVWFDSLAGMWIQDSVCAQSLVKFNLAAIPAGKTIVSATLRLQTNIYGVGYVPRSWFVRALATNANWGASVTWNSALSFQYYLASASNYFPPTYVSQIYNIDQTNTVRNWVGGTYVNNGLEFGISNVLFPYATSLDAFDFFSSEDPSGRGPKLIVTYQ
jgi:uncharacterized protein YjdB